jgi:hypothetical protein
MKYRRENGRKMTYRREEWKDNGTQKREVEERWSTVERSGRKMG